MTLKSSAPIHIAFHRNKRLDLKQTAENSYSWFLEEKNLKVGGINPEEACQAAHAAWGKASFRFLHCGTRFTLPERDEHGQRALFAQMCASYSAPGGIYFDEELGHSCIVKEASQEAQDLWRLFR